MKSLTFQQQQKLHKKLDKKESREHMQPPTTFE